MEGARVMTRGFGDLVAKLGDKVVMEVLVRCWSNGDVVINCQGIIALHDVLPETSLPDPSGTFCCMYSGTVSGYHPERDVNHNLDLFITLALHNVFPITTMQLTGLDYGSVGYRLS
ncbi:hypothetical protein Tco_1052206 [Tanacetum coccineum]